MKKSNVYEDCEDNSDLPRVIVEEATRAHNEVEYHKGRRKDKMDRLRAKLQSGLDSPMVEDFNPDIFLARLKDRSDVSDRSPNPERPDQHTAVNLPKR
ncbi:hypothetical protein [Sedimenticola selenatireducens]|uniref:hypothetical protein n=1 Tax=Sedimenticola selenatireducens TaxID=191960 RepID=UPI002AAB1936|nr:hypothetical protein [Sedimenticola selenatireducens]